MLKATSVNKRGVESYPSSLEVNDSGYVELPEDPDAISYNLYAPLEGFEECGPWYFKKAYRRSEARRARFTVVGLSKDQDLSSVLCRHALDDLNPPYMFTLPTPEPGQEFWVVGGSSGLLSTHYTPYAIIKCPGVH